MEGTFVRIIGNVDEDRVDSDALCNCTFSSGCRFNSGYLEGYSESVMIIENEDG